MSDLTAARARWCLLRTLHPLFPRAESLPKVEDADQYRDDTGAFDDHAIGGLDHLKNEITTLRNDLKLNVMKQQQVEAGQLIEDDAVVEGLKDELESVLVQLEDLVDPTVVDLEESQPSLEPGSFNCFPRLVALRAILKGRHEEAASLKDEKESAYADETCADTALSWGRRYSSQLVAHAASFIRFPQNATRIESCRRFISRFGTALDRTLYNSSVSCTMETQTLVYTPQDLEAIQRAQDFASTCTSLFSQMVDSVQCGTPHQAKLHLSGFKEDQLQMHIRTCNETDWISTVFTRSPEPPSPDLCLDGICSIASSPTTEPKVTHVSFNSEGMWASSGAAGHDPRGLLDSRELSLDHYLNIRNSLALKYRKLAGVLLAVSMFQLNDSPWIQHHLGTECIFMPAPDNKRSQQWCPRALCTLVRGSCPGLKSDSIAAFGVLVLELEAERKASWTEDDEDWITGEKSNHVRLARVLMTWEDCIMDDYRRVAKACLEFDSLIEGLDHPDIIPERKELAIIYKCILEPLFRLGVNSFGNLADTVKGLFGPGRSLTAPMDISQSVTAKRVLFDDDDSVPEPDAQKNARVFLNDLKRFFDRIRNLHEEWKYSNPLEYITHERIRIVVLDSGVDETDSLIRSAIKFGRINTQKSKSFVGPDEWREDSCGHGTHVAQLLLETAPAAEIYVGKICTGKVINDEFMPGIAKAIDWAVKECDAHIISMSFGFEDDHDPIDAAVDKAIQAGKLIIAAASNGGGLSRRTRPARSEDVICIHATDGKGNKGGMNPSPLPKGDNFATLGVAVPCRWKGNDVPKSGTSFAVPIAAGFAACIMEFAKYRCNLTDRKLKKLQRKQGMQLIFREMAELRDGYDFVHPVRLCRDWGDPRTEQQAVKAIQQIMEEL
ncbi:subtilisin-like protein [Triangularia verruculosa]|uniref:Subtilisin-like protein n=1 Tax=Triangularia verruculosa TaxID=2587418 RepID=A0AAN7AQ46_9PEZI|nr:subtilisin-like protein [Triangularia verruculosa]